MYKKNSPSSTINKYRKRQRSGPMLVTILAVALIVVGLILLVGWFFSGDRPSISLFSTDTPTPTLTYTPTVTLTPTMTPTVTLTPTQTATPTASAPFLYAIQEGDTLYSVVEKFGLGDDGLELLFYLNPQIDSSNPVIQVGQEITVPNPDMPLPTATPIPADLRRGTKVVYVVRSGDSLALIASNFNSTIEAILALKENQDAGLTDPTAVIFVGQKIVVPVNMVTPTPTQPPTITPTAAP